MSSRDYRARRPRLRAIPRGRPPAPVSVRRSPVSRGRATARSWQRADWNGRRVAGRGAVAELALEIRAPAVGGVERGCAGDATRVEPSRAHGNKGEPTGHLHGREALRNRRTSAQLAGLAESPAVRRPRRRDAARVAAITGAGAQRGETEATKDSDRARCERHRPVAQLTPEVLAPAIGDIRGGHAAGVGRAGGHAREAQSTGYRHGRDAARERSRGWPTLLRPARRIVAELTGAIASPAVRRSRSRDAAGVPAPGADHGKGEPPVDRDGHGAARERLAERATGLRPGGRVVTQLAALVETPAVRRARSRNAARMIGSRAHGREAESAGDGHRCRAARHEVRHSGDPTQLRPTRGTIAELAEVAGPPTLRRAHRGDAAGMTATDAQHHKGVRVRDERRRQNAGEEGAALVGPRRRIGAYLTPEI